MSGTGESRSPTRSSLSSASSSANSLISTLEPRASARGSCLRYEWRAVPRTGEARPRVELRFGYGSAAAPRVGVGESPDGELNPNWTWALTRALVAEDRLASDDTAIVALPASEGLPRRGRDPRRRGRRGAVLAPLARAPTAGSTFLVLAVSARRSRSSSSSSPRATRLPHDDRLPHPRRAAPAAGAVALIGDRVARPRVAEGSLPLVHPVLQHLQPHAERPGGVGGGRLVRRRRPRARARVALSGLVAAVVFVGTNHVLLATMLHLARGHSLRETGLFSAESLSTDFVLAMLGVAFAALWD